MTADYLQDSRAETLRNHYRGEALASIADPKPEMGNRLHLMQAITDAEAAGFTQFARALKAEYKAEFPE